MMSSFAVGFFTVLLLGDFPGDSQGYTDFGLHDKVQSNKHFEKRSIMTFPPDSVLQINVGITLTSELEKNSGVVVLSFQQNAPLPSETLPLIAPSAVVSARKFSIYDHLRDVISSYGLNGSECLRKMICQVSKTPLLGGLLEDVVAFALTPSRHRSLQYDVMGPQQEEQIYENPLLESEELGKSGVMKMLLKLTVVLGLVVISRARASKALEYASSRIKRNVLFPSGSGMGIYLALALPLDLPEYEISMSFNYEANYILPTNATELALGPQYTEIRKARSITREKVYSYIEDNMKNGGLLGKPCLLRTICETQANPILGHNGLIGDLIHILFTPSTTSPEGISDDYNKAEEEGLKGKENCARMYGDCPIDLYDLFSIWNH